MQIKILSVTRRSNRALQTQEEEYLKRIQKHIPCILTEVKRLKFSESGQEKNLRGEARKIVKGLRKSDFLVVLTEKGREMTSQDMVHFLKEKICEGHQDLVFLVGGPLGLAGELEALARLRLSLSKMTFSHGLARLMLVEAIYRAVEIMRGGKYPK